MQNQGHAEGGLRGRPIVRCIGLAELLREFGRVQLLLVYEGLAQV